MAGEPKSYEIVVKGHLNSGWSEWLEEMSVTHLDTGDTVLSGTLADQAALHGVLAKIRDLGLCLLSVQPIGPGDDAAQAE